MAEELPQPPPSDGAPEQAAPQQGPTILAPQGKYSDHTFILNRIKEQKRRWSIGRQPFLWADERNILYYRAIQWIVRDRAAGGRWRHQVLPDASMPKPVTNKFGETLDALISVLARIEPNLIFGPATDEVTDRATAEVASRVMEVIEDEVGLREIRQYLAPWVGMTGGAWLETGYDPDPKWGMTVIEVPDPMTGQTVQREEPIGRMYVDVISRFEMYFDPSVPIWRKQNACLRETSYSLDEMKARYPGLDVQPDSMPNDMDQIMGRLATLGPGLGDSGQYRDLFAGSQIQQQNDRATEGKYWELPSDDFPEGLLAVVIGGKQIAAAMPIPTTALIEGGARRPFIPIVEFMQKFVPGTAWRKTVADDLAIKQAQRNRCEALFEMTFRTMGLPKWLIPTSANVQHVTGAIDAMMYNPFSSGGVVKPERIPGQPPSMAFVEWMAMIDRDFEGLAGTFDIIKGGRPQGVSAGIALQILQERGMSRFAPLFILWEHSHSEWAGQAIEIFRQYVTEPRMLRIQGRDGNWQVETFTRENLQGRVNIRAEAASSMPRSTLVLRAEMEQLAALGVIDPNDPDVKIKWLEAYGHSDLLPALKVESRNAYLENEAFRMIASEPGLATIDPAMVRQMAQGIAQSGQNPNTVLIEVFKQAGIELPRVRNPIDDHGTHIREHLKEARGEAFKAWPEIAQMAFEAHLAEHRMIAQQQMMMMQQGRQGTHPTSGFLSNPGGQMGPTNANMNGGRMAGEQRELERQTAAGDSAS